MHNKMKKHFVNIEYDFDWVPNGYEYKYPKYIFRGLVTGLEEDGQVYINPVKLFENAFKIKFPERGKITYG